MVYKNTWTRVAANDFEDSKTIIDKTINKIKDRKNNQQDGEFEVTNGEENFFYNTYKEANDKAKDFMKVSSRSVKIYKNQDLITLYEYYSHYDLEDLQTIDLEYHTNNKGGIFIKEIGFDEND